MASMQTERTDDPARVNQHQELMPPMPPDPVSPDDLAAVFARLEDVEQGLAAMRPALWPGWWTIDMTGMGEQPELRAARRAWGVGHGKEGAPEYLVLVYDRGTADRLHLSPPAGPAGRSGSPSPQPPRRSPRAASGAR